MQCKRVLSVKDAKKECLGGHRDDVDGAEKVEILGDARVRVEAGDLFVGVIFAEWAFGTGDWGKRR
jgi:hypothetical protein